MTTEMERGTFGRLSLQRLSMQRLSKRFSRARNYDKVDDTGDSRVPLHNEEAFQHGIQFKAKYIGSLEIARPSSKVDIITAMRRIRYEYKVKGIKKKRAVITISTKGVEVKKRSRRKRAHENEDDLQLMSHPIYRIFYVSHDSQDLKIFSYITREVPENNFRCNVFKAYKKRMALHVVRTLGQAFDVCHKLNPRPKKKKAVTAENNEGDGTAEENKTNDAKEEPLPNENDPSEDTTKLNGDLETPKDLINLGPDPFSFGLATLGDIDPLAIVPPPHDILNVSNGTINTSDQTALSRPRPRPVTGSSTVQANPLTGSQDSLKNDSMSPSVSIGDPLTNFIDGGRKENEPPGWEMERKQLVSQMSLLQQQLQQETSQRIESQARVEHLLLQNKELLSHLQKLMIQLQQIQTLQMPQPQSTTTPTDPTNNSSTSDPPTQTPPTSTKEPEVTNQNSDNSLSDDVKTTPSHDNATFDAAFTVVPVAS